METSPFAEKPAVNTLTLSLGLRLCWPEGDGLAAPAGALFHRWLPQGPADAINLHLPTEPHRLSVWFERRGYVHASGFIQYDSKRREVDDAVVPLQWRLDGGPLLGECVLHECNDAELAAVYGSKVDDPDYVAVGKRAVRYLQPKIAAFVDLLRYRFGQYWIEPVYAWDSRRESLGHYCYGFSLKWKDPNSGTWNKFAPTQLSATLTSALHPGRDLDQLLTQEDWRELQAACASGKPASPILPLLGRVNQLIDRGELRAAFLEAHSAAEVALATRMTVLAGSNPELTKRRNEFESSVSVATRLWAVLSLDPQFPSEEIESVVDAVRIRNSIAHEGIEPNRDDLYALLSLVKAARVIAQIPSFKLPALTTGNRLSPPVDPMEIRLGIDLD